MGPRAVTRFAGLFLVAAGGLAMAFRCASAAQPSQEGTPTSAPAALTVQEAVTRALARSAEVQLARVAAEERELAVLEAQVGEAEGQPRRAVRQALEEREAARNAFLSAVFSAAAQVEESYYDVLRQQQTLAVRTQTLQQAQRQLQLAQARFEAGTISRQELLEAEDAAQRAEEGVVQARRALSVAEATLRALVGLEPGASLNLAEGVVLEFIEPDLSASLQWALANRREVREAEAAVRMAHEQVQATDNPHTPPVERERARLALRRAEWQLEQARERVAGEVRSQWLQLAAARQRVEASRRAQELSSSRLAIAQARYEAGQIAFLDLLKAQADDASAQLEAVSAVWDYNLQTARWLRAVARAPLPPLPDELQRWMAGWQDSRGQGTP